MTSKKPPVQVIAQTVEVTSMTDPEVTYNVNTKAQTCDCPAWRNGLTRPCKHIKHVLGMNTMGDDLAHEVAAGIKNAPRNASVAGMSHDVFTIGHSNYRLEDFLVMLVEHGIKRLVDVRSYPTSRYSPQFRKDSLHAACEKVGIHYHWYGRILGGKSKYETTSPEFKNALRTVQRMAEDGQTPAMMCSERDPAKCHRAYKLAAYYHRYDSLPDIWHIVPDGLINSTELEDSLPTSWLTHEYGGDK